MTENREQSSRDLLEGIVASKQRVLDAHRTEAVARQRSLGKGTARQRIDTLVDDGSFHEVGSLVEPRREGPAASIKDAPADGVVCGTAKLQSRPVSVLASDFTVHGGSFGLIGSMKAERQAQLCLKHGYPLIQLHDGGGHRIQEALDSADAARGIGIVNAFSTLASLSGWVPIVCGMLGPTFAAPANVSAMADFVVAVRGTARIGIAGPALVKVALGEESTADELGDPDMQARNGIIDRVEDSESAALSSIERFLSYLPSNAGESVPMAEPTDPARDPETLVDIVPAAKRRAYDVRDVIAGIVDAETFFELKPDYAKNAIVGLSRVGGRAIGVIANQPMHLAGSLTAPSCEKIARFISMCDAFGLPLVFLTDTPGLMIGQEAEASGLLRRSAKIVHELGQATVPRISITLRKGYGLGYILMGGGRDFDADAAMIWPTADLCGMQVEGAVDVAHRKEIAASDNPEGTREAFIEQYRSLVGVYRAASAYGIDEVIDPSESRAKIIETFSRTRSRRVRVETPKYHPIPPV